QPGSSLLPPAWLGTARLERALRAVARDGAEQLLAYGSPLGYLPLRQQIGQELAELGIGADADQIITTLGTTGGIDLVGRSLLRGGDAVAVEEPSQWLRYARFHSLGVRIFSVARRSDVPDLVAIEHVLQTHRPRLFLIASALHDPTGTILSAARAYQLLQVAERYDVTLVEYDAMFGLAPPRATRLAALDQLQRVIYLSGFSRSIGANLRVGFVACHPHMAERLLAEKLA